MSTTTTLRAAALAAVVALGAGGCGGSTEESTADKLAERAQQQASRRPAPAAPRPPQVTKIEPTAGEADLDKKPQIPRPQGAPPKQLKVEDVIVGKGAAAKTGDQLSVEYVGVLYKDGRQFDTSWGKGNQPFRFQLGSGQVIKGWDQGLLGMKVGGRRKLTIPPDLAYGAEGQPPAIGPNETLIFEIDLKKIG